LEGNEMTRRHSQAGAGTIVAILAGILLFNASAAFGLLGWRLDLTHDGLYSFSAGTRAIIASLREPVRLDLYYSRDALADIPALRAHAQRVVEYLEELVLLSGDALELRVIAPAPFSQEEDDARAAGLLVQPLNNAGATAILGLVAAGPTGQTKSIPLFSPERDTFLEYDIAKAISTVGRTTKPRVALLSCMPLTPDTSTASEMIAPPGREPYVVQQMRELFRVVDVPVASTTIPEEVDALLVVQPRKLGDGLLRAIDAWAIAGRPLLVLADPFAESDTHPDSRELGAKVPATAYDFPLFEGWGIDSPRDMVVGDLDYATRIQTAGPSGTMRELNYVAWLSLTPKALADDHPLTAGLAAINLKSAGEIRRREAMPPSVAPTIEPLIISSDRSQLIQTLKLGYFGDAEQLLRDCKPDGVHRAIAARVTGQIVSPFTGSTGQANIVVIADADLLWDMTWVQDDTQTGMKRAFADNGPLVIGLLELMAGDPAVATLRSRGAFQRPFERVEELRKQAETKYIAREKDLQLELRKTEITIAQMRGAAGGGDSGRMLLSEAQLGELARLEQTVNEYRRELRGVQFELRSGVDTLGQRLLLLNVVLWPALVACATGVWCWLSARRVVRTAAHDQG
jgi:ABC-type uncharacterized transport system involved in gliding motility auxiliary subunit